MLVCCNQSIETESDFTHHFKRHHYLNSDYNENFKCILCSKRCAYLKNLKRHFIKKHPNIASTIFNLNYNQIDDTNSINLQSNDLNDTALLSDNFQLNDNLEYSDNEIDSDSDISHTDEDEDEDELSNEIEESTQDLINSGYQFVEIEHDNENNENNNDNLKNNLAKLVLNGKNMRMTEKSIITYTTEYNSILRKYADSNGKIDVALLEKVDQHFKSSYQMLKTIFKNDKKPLNRIVRFHSHLDKNLYFYYLPLIYYINKILNNSNLKQKLENERMIERNQNELNTFKDGSLFDKLQIDSDNEFTLLLQLFFDDFVTTKRSQLLNKLVIFTLSLNNLPLKEIAKPNNIYLTLIGKRKIINQLGIDNFLKPLLDDIKGLDSKRIQLPGGLTLRIKLSTTIGDSLAIHELLKITRSFRSKSCRFCLISYNQLQQSIDTIIELREMGNNCLSDLIFELVQFCPDIFHDFCENGVIHKIMKHILIKYYSVSAINMLMVKLRAINWRYGKIESIYTSSSNYGKIKGAGMQILDFFLAFAYLDTQVPRESFEFKIYTLLKEIIIFCFSDKIDVTKINDLEQKIIYFQKLVFDHIVEPSQNETNKKITFTMKLHWIKHYVVVMLAVGPLLNQCTLKNERFIHTLNNYLAGSNCTKNLPYSIAKWFSIFFEKNFHSNPNEYNLIRKIFCNQLDDQYKPFFNGNLNQEIEILKSCEISNTLFMVNCMYLFDYQDNDPELPIFIQLKTILKQANNIFVIGEIFETESYDKNKTCFKIYSTNELDVLDDLENVLFYKPLYFFDSNLILNDFCQFYDLDNY